MHELSLAMSIVELAEEESQNRGGLRIAAVHLRLGLLAGAVKDALLSSYEMACEDTILEARVSWWKKSRASFTALPAAPAGWYALRSGFAVPSAALWLPKSYKEKNWK